MVGAAAAVIGVTVPTHAYTIFFGEDLNNSPNIPLRSFPNPQTAEANFLSRLTNTGIETFESFTPTTGGRLTLTSQSGIAATLHGSGSIVSVPPGTTNGLGRYSIYGRNFWEANADWGQFWITFNQTVAAFGFYGIDIGDFGGQLVLNLGGGRMTQLTVPNTIGRTGSTDGSVLYFGIIADNREEYFTSILFNMSTGQGDVFAFDNMTFGSIEEVIPSDVSIGEPKVAIPESSSVFGAIALGAIGATSLLLRQRQRR